MSYLFVFEPFVVERPLQVYSPVYINLRRGHMYRQRPCFIYSSGTIV